ncbi:LysR family transcriptional regulator [Uliginosibacterium sediminicola]|uniref:LysR family transcriptional regulator n=1 Tax=Uliginosibacterium sediminicola TaxID=2024550 RepID=A0ABU9YW87_9RHOO
MNLRFVEAFHWAVSLNSVTRAAQKLHITQSALSARIAALEDELGTVLVDRRDKQFRLTVAGQRFHALAVRLLDMQRLIKEEMGRNASGPVVLRIGAIESVVHSWLPGWIQQMRQTHPDFALELTVETSPVLIDQVRRGAQDLVFAAIAASDASLRTRHMRPMPMVFVGHTERHVEPCYSLQELASCELLTFQRGSQPHQALLELFQREQLPSPRIHAISSISAMVQLVEGGLGVATLPEAAVQQLSRHSPLRVLRTTVQLAPLPIYASYREDPTSNLTDSVFSSALAYLKENALEAEQPDTPEAA